MYDEEPDRHQHIGGDWKRWTPGCWRCYVEIHPVESHLEDHTKKFTTQVNVVLCGIHRDALNSLSNKKLGEQVNARVKEAHFHPLVLPVAGMWGTDPTIYKGYMVDYEFENLKTHFQKHEKSFEFVARASRNSYVDLQSESHLDMEGHWSIGLLQWDDKVFHSASGETVSSEIEKWLNDLINMRIIMRGQNNNDFVPFAFNNVVTNYPVPPPPRPSGRYQPVHGRKRESFLFPEGH